MSGGRIAGQKHKQPATSDQPTVMRSPNEGQAPYKGLSSSKLPPSHDERSSFRHTRKTATTQKTGGYRTIKQHLHTQYSNLTALANENGKKPGLGGARGGKGWLLSSSERMRALSLPFPPRRRPRLMSGIDHTTDSKHSLPSLKSSKSERTRPPEPREHHAAA